MDDNQPGPSSGGSFSNNQRVKRPRLDLQPVCHVRDFEGLVNNTLDDELEDEDDTDSDPDYVIDSEHDTDSDQSDSEVRDADQALNARNVEESQQEEAHAADVNHGEEQYDRQENVLEGINEPAVLQQEERQDVGLPLPRQRGEGTYYYGRRTKLMVKKKIPPFKWRREPPAQNVRTRQENIVTQLPGLKNHAKAIGPNPDVESVWNLLITNDILNEIITWTNVKIGSLRARYNKPTSYTHDIHELELKAFIGLMIYTAVFKSGNEAASSLFATDGTGREIFRCVMTKERFLFLLQAMRFDNSEDRHERKKDMKEAAIGKIFYKFVENSQACYSTGVSVCIDEMLVAFRGRCAFKMFMPKKPAKYGLKIQCLTDAKTNYLYNAYIYTGRGSDGKGLSEEQQKKFLIPTQAVLKLIKPIQNTNKNITADNWYSSIELAQELKTKGLTYVGTLKKNKLEVPNVFLADREKAEKSFMYAYQDRLTLVSYVPKQSKVVLLISTMHHGPQTDERTGKPEIIAEYNRTKAGVDTLDQMCSNYNTQRRSRRWPMTIFYTMINVSAGVNAYVLYKAFQDTEDVTRYDFMKSLAKSLCRPHLLRRLDTGTHVRDEMKEAIRRILQIPRPEPQGIEVFASRKTCYTCNPRLKRRTKYPCSVCEKPICLECAKKVCVRCLTFLNQQ